MELINNSFSSDDLLYFFKIISYFYRIEIFAVYYFLAIIVYLNYFYKVNNSHQVFVRTFNNFITIGISYAVTGIIFAILKYNVNFVRPLCDHKLFTIITEDMVRCFSSFPSGHSAVATLILLSLYPILGFTSRVLLIMLSSALFIARVSLATHYPADVVYSIVMTSIIFIISRLLVSSLMQIIIKPLGRFIFVKLRSV